MGKYWRDICENVASTITIVQTTDDEVFGGYASVPFNSMGHDKSKRDEKAFLFSVDLEKKFPLIKGQEDCAVFDAKDNGPDWGCSAELSFLSTGFGMAT